MRTGARRPSPAPAPAPKAARPPFRVVVLACGELGTQVASALDAVPGVRVAALVTAPWRTRRRNPLGRMRHLHRKEDWRGVGRALARRLAGRRLGPTPAPLPPPGVTALRFEDFHDEAALAALRGLRADLGVLAGTYILRDEVFSIPRLGSINLHCGKVPEYRGSAPGFWELYNGERWIGITVHRVTAALDAGAVLAEALLPLDPPLEGDPMRYLENLRQQVLLPHGVRLLAGVVADLADGAARGRPQDVAAGRTWPSPDHRDVVELRRREAFGRPGDELDGRAP